MLTIPHSSALVLTGGVVTGVPDLDQLHEPTLDGAADENTRDNCVFTCNADLSRFFRPDLNADGDAIKDSIPAYGQGYVGFSSQDVIIRSGELEAKWGTYSWRIDAPNRANLLEQLIALANAGTPSIVTIPSLWGSQPSQPGYNPDQPNFYTHACVFAGTLADGTCVLCNPWGGFLMYYSQADMALRLCYLCAYPVVKEVQAKPMITIEKDASGNVTGAHDEHGGHVGAGMALAIEQHGWTSDTIAVAERQEGGVQVAVLANSASPHAVLTYTAKFNVGAFDAPDLAIAVQALFAARDAADTQIQTLEQQLTAAKAQPPVVAPPPDPTAAPLRTALEAFLSAK